MIDRIFAAVLTFSILIGGTLAIGSAVVGKDMQAVAPTKVAAREIQLPRVVVTAKREVPVLHVALAN